jgi:hypothetical protein
MSQRSTKSATTTMTTSTTATTTLPCKRDYDGGVLVSMFVETQDLSMDSGDDGDNDTDDDDDDEGGAISIKVLVWFKNQDIFNGADGGGSYDTIQHLMYETRPFVTKGRETLDGEPPEMTGVVELGSELTPASIDITRVDLFVFDVMYGNLDCIVVSD